MSVILAILLWVGALLVVLALAGGVRRGDAMRDRALASRFAEGLEDEPEYESTPGGGRHAAPRLSRPAGDEGRRVVRGGSGRLTG